MTLVTRRRVLLVVLALFLAGIGHLAWVLAGLPPVKYCLRYGLVPFCEPTGERITLETVEFVEIGPGIFLMGTESRTEGGDWLGRLCEPFGLPWGEPPRPTGDVAANEQPARWVEFRRGFWIATTEVTNAQYERFRKDAERCRYSPGDDTPAVNVSWKDARAWCAWLEEKTGRPVRLPSEAEWECACRAGGSGEFTCGDDEAVLRDYALFSRNSGIRAEPVGSKLQNRWGLHDLHGSVWEWCEDTRHTSYEGAPEDGSAWITGGWPGRITRGGAWNNPAMHLRSAERMNSGEDDRTWELGFRPVFTSADD